MFWYLAILMIISIFSCYERISGVKNKPLFLITAFIVITFVATRYETGFDWVEYEKFYSYISPFWDNSGIYVPPDVQMEPGFGFLMSAFKTIGMPFQGVTFIISCFSIGTIAWFANRYSPRPILVLVWYFGFSLLPAQMAAIRQGLSFSILLIALALLQNGRFKTSVASSAIACTVHVFSIAISPLMYLRNWQPKTIYVLVFSAIGIVSALSSIDILDIASKNALSLLGAGNLLADKLNIYNGGAGSTVSLTGLSLTIWDILFLYLVEKRKRSFHDAEADVIVGFAVNCALFSVFAHSFLATFPAIWNRVSYISMLMEMIVLTRWYDTVIIDAVKKQFITIGLSGVSAAVLVYGLSAPSALPYLPYQSLLGVWATGNEGDGRLRYNYAMQQAEREIQLAKTH